jgi:prepilin-type N-terminal cleavage/methylation domain-containing protein/prepilin-type processing-associated H-X9-DG protein
VNEEPREAAGDSDFPMKLTGASSGTLKPSRGFTLIELLAVTAVIMLILALCLPSLVAVKHRARETVCRGNLRQVACALTMYVDEQGGFPGRVRYPDALHVEYNQLQQVQMFDKVFWQLSPYFSVPVSRLHSEGTGFHQPFAWNCPAVPAISFPRLFSEEPDLRYPPGFGYNAAGTAPPGSMLDFGLSPRCLWLFSTPQERECSAYEMKWTAVASPAGMIAFGDDRDELAYDLRYHWTKDQVCPMRPGEDGCTDLLGQRHREGANAVFCDAHVEYRKTRVWLAPTDTARRQWNADNQAHPETWR